MDEDELEMLSEARARLANTQGIFLPILNAALQNIASNLSSSILNR